MRVVWEHIENEIIFMAKLVCALTSFGFCDRELNRNLQISYRAEVPARISPSQSSHQHSEGSSPIIIIIIIIVIIITDLHWWILGCVSPPRCVTPLIFISVPLFDFILISRTVETLNTDITTFMSRYTAVHHRHIRS